MKGTPEVQKVLTVLFFSPNWFTQTKKKDTNERGEEEF